MPKPRVESYKYCDNCGKYKHTGQILWKWVDGEKYRLCPTCLEIEKEKLK